MTAEDIRRTQRIARERAEGTYVEWGALKFRELIATRDAGQSLKRVRSPYGTPATDEELARAKSRRRAAKATRDLPASVRPKQASLRNQRCPCGSGRKTKHCCADRRPPADMTLPEE